MRALANLNDRTLKLICGEKNSRQVPLSFPLSLSRLVSISMAHTQTHIYICIHNILTTLAKCSRDPYLNVRCNPFALYISAAAVTVAGSLEVIIFSGLNRSSEAYKKKKINTKKYKTQRHVNYYS